MSNKVNIPVWSILGVLGGFPLISYLLSLMLLERTFFYNLGLDFFMVFWSLICLWYLIQIFLILKILNLYNWSPRDIGYSWNAKKTLYLVTAYLTFAFLLFGFVEWALASANIDAEKLNSLSDFSNITPKTSAQRILFIFTGLVAGMSEELIYRGFAITSLESHKVNKWIAVVLAAIPFVFQHGLKSLDQFWWFFISGLVLGAIYILCKRKLVIPIIIHWLVILSALLAILQVLE